MGYNYEQMYSDMGLNLELRTDLNILVAGKFTHLSLQFWSYENILAPEAVFVLRDMSSDGVIIATVTYYQDIVFIHNMISEKSGCSLAFRPDAGFDECITAWLDAWLNS